MKYIKSFKKIQSVNEAEIPNEEKEPLEKEVKESPKSEDFEKVNNLLDSDYENFIKALTGEGGVPSEEKIAKVDPKVQSILNMGKRDAKVKDEVINFQRVNLPVKNLKPTQSQIGLQDSIGFIAFVDPDKAKSSLSGNADFGGGAILTSDNKYILDGHHRWSQVFMMNPNAQIPAINLNLGLDGKEALKVVQLAIAADMGHIFMKPANAKTDIFNDDITGGSGEKLVELLNKIFNGDYGVPKGGSSDNVEKFKKILEEAWDTDEKGVIEKLAEHAKMIKEYKPADAPPRGFMPQPSDTAQKLGKPKDDGPGGMPSGVIQKLASGDLNYKKAIEPNNVANPSEKVVDNFNNFLKNNK